MSSMIKISERTLYEPIVKFLEQNLKVRAISEVRARGGFLDILFQLNSSTFLIEVKIGGEERTLTKASSSCRLCP